MTQPIAVAPVVFGFRFTPFSIALLALLLFPVFASAQTLNLSSGVRSYTALTNTTVNMSGRCELRVTSSTTPLAGCIINLNSPDAWLILPGIKPSAAVSTYLSQVRISGGTAVADSNCRVVQYAMGAVVIPHSSTFQPLTVFSGPHFTGSSMALSQYNYYKGTGLGVMNANISSFRLKRGYMATVAQTVNGTGISKCYVAQDGDMEISVLPDALDDSIRFVYVLPWRWVSKKGIGGDIEGPLNVQWKYNWNINQNSARDREYVPIRQSRWWPGLSQDWKARGANTLLGYNEPDRPDQANMAVSDAISSWPDLLGTGLRLGSPVTSDGGRSWWLYPFIAQADAADLRLDFVPVHYYWCVSPGDAAGAANQLYNFLKETYDQVKRPLWVTEWNNGANWTGCGDPNSSQQQAAIAAMIDMLDKTPFVERYAPFNWVEDVRRLAWDDGSLTSAGVSYRDNSSPIGYVQALQDNGTRSFTQLKFDTNTLDSSGYGNNGITAGAPAYTNGHSGQALVFDGTNTVVTLPPNAANNSGFTFAGWIYWKGGANWQRIFDFGNSTTHYMFLTPNGGSGMRFGIANGGADQTVTVPALATGSWQHVAVTHNGGTVRIYVNGAQVGSGSISITPANFSPRYNFLGKSQFIADPNFNGFMDDVLITDYSLSADQIAALQTNTPPQFTTNFLARSNATNAVAYADSIAGTVTDVDGDTLTFSKAVGPAWLSVAGDGSLSGVPTSADGGTNHFTVRITDSAGQSGFALLTINVIVANNSSVWIADASANWSETARWSNSVVASGIGQTADFSAINITANRSVTLNSSRAIGSMKFGDASGAQSWTITNTPGAKLTLDTGTAASPALVVTNTATLATPLAGTNGFTKSGPGLLILSGDNSLSGTVNIDTGSTTLSDGITRVVGPSALANASLISIRNNNSGNSTLEIDGASGAVTVNAPLTATYRNNSVVTIRSLAGTNIFNGNLQLYQGGDSFTVQADADSLIVFTRTNQYVGDLTGTRTNYFTGPGNHLLVGPIINSTNGSPISLTKSGLGTLTLEADNTYGNGTLLSGGALIVNGSLPAGSFSISGGTTLGGHGIIQPSVIIPATATLAPGASIGTLTVSNAVTLQAGSFTRMEINRDAVSNNCDQLHVTGLLTFGGTLTVSNLSGTLVEGDSFKLFDAAGSAGSFAASDLPALDPGLTWSFNQTLGVLAVAATTNTAPAISSLANETINEDTATAALAFAIGDAETSAGSLIVGATSSNPSLVPAGNIVFGGSGSNRTVTITPATNQSGSATITVTVSDGTLYATTSFLLTVNAVNDAPVISAIANQTWNRNVAIGPLAFTVGDPETAAGSLALSAASSNTNLIPTGNIVFGGSGSNRTVTLTPSLNLGGSSTITVTVSDGSLAANTQFQVTVTAPSPISKADNAIALNSGSSWVGGNVLGAGNIAVWDSIVTSANAVALGADATWHGLSISNPAGPVTITAGNTLTLGASGIDMSAAMQNLTVSSGLALGTANHESWNVASGRTLALNTGTFARGAGATLNLPGTGTVSSTMTGLTNDNSAPGTGIIGAWATTGVGASTAFATANAGSLVAYTSATVPTGGAATGSWGNIPSGGTGTTNYDLTQTTAVTFGVGRNVNTARHLAGATTVTIGNSSGSITFAFNGIMNAGSGTLTFAKGGTGTATGVAAGTRNELVLNAANANIAVTAPIYDGSAASGLTVGGANTVTLSGANGYSGDTTVTAGKLQLGAANVIPDGTGKGNVALNGTLDLNTFSDTINGLSGAGILDTVAGGTPTLTVGNNNVSSTFSGVLRNTAGTLSLAKIGSGTLTLAGSSSYTGATTIGTGGGAAVLRAAATQALGVGGTITFDPTGNASTARLELIGDIILANPVTFSGRNNSSVGIQNISGNNTLAGTITLAVGGGTYLIQSDAGTLMLGSTGNTAITSTGSKTVTLQGAGNGVVAGDIVNGAGVAVFKTGSGTWTLAGNNSYANGTAIGAGRLLVNGTLGTGTVTVSNGATLGGSGVINGTVIPQAGSTIAPGNSIGTLTINAGLNLSGTTLMEISKSPLTNDQLRVTGTLTYDGTLTVVNLGGPLAAGDSFHLFDATSVAGDFAVKNLPALDPGLLWDFNSDTGVLTVAAIEAPPVLGVVRNGSALDFSWSSSSTYKLQAQTNSASVGLIPGEGAWFDYPGGDVSPVNVPIDPAQPTMFFRLAPAP